MAAPADQERQTGEAAAPEGPVRIQMETIRREEGCLAYDYFLAAEDGDCLLLVEKWATGEQQQTHMAQPHMKTLAEIKGRWIAQTSIERIDLEEEKQN